MSDLKQYLQRIIDLGGEATPGPWEADTDINECSAEAYAIGPTHSAYEPGAGARANRDAAYIASLPPEVGVALATFALFLVREAECMEKEHRFAFPGSSIADEVSALDRALSDAMKAGEHEQSAPQAPSRDDSRRKVPRYPERENSSPRGK
jgi:hypothetical protein